MVRLYEIYEETNKKSIEEIREIFLDNFQVVHGDYTIDSNGVIDVDGRCDAIFAEHMDRLPVTFGEIIGDFNCVSNGLKSFKGFPRIVEGNLNCSSNLFTSLEDSPQRVNGIYFMCHTCPSLESLKGLSIKHTALIVDDCPIKSLDGLNTPLRELHITWTPELPLLRALYYVTDSLALRGSKEDKTYRKVSRIINDFIKSPENIKKKLIECQYALIKAGFRGNARW